MRVSIFLRALTGAAMLAAPASAIAQANPQTRDGLTMGFGFGAGRNGYTCADCGSVRRDGGIGYLTIGGAISPTLVVAGEMNGWSRSQADVEYTTVFVGPTLQWYPSAGTGFFLKTGVGIGALRVKENSVFSQDELTSHGLGYQVGTGYDLRVARNFSLTPFVGFAGTWGANLSVNGQSMNEKFDGNFIQYGLGFTWH